MRNTDTPRRAWCALAVTAVLCALAYWRALGLPLISDDYLQIQLGRAYGPLSGWKDLLVDPLYRCRATSLVITYWTDRLFGLNAFVFNLSSLLLHIVNSWLVLALGEWKVVGWRVSFFAACFFAVYEGHQEAVMWYAALPELLVFFFSLGTLLLWLRWRESGGSRERWYAAAVACFVLALLSKESGVATVPLLAITLLAERTAWKHALVRLLPFAGLSAAYFALIYLARSGHLFFHDGTFSLHGPFWIVLPVSVSRLLWVWGLFALSAIAAWRARQWSGLLWVSTGWVVATLLPYSFLTYMPRVPSRHTYFASAGLALVVGAAFVTLRDRCRRRPWLPAALAAVVVAQQCVYIWTRKQGQFLERAAATEQLLRVAHQQRKGVLRVRCFPYDRSIAEAALEVNRLNPVRLVFADSASQGVDFCAD
jgi:hypothetical protein